MDIVTYALLNGKIKDYASNVDKWLEENVDPATGYVLDRSLQMENAAAPADMVGDINDEVGDLKNTLNHKADVIYDTASGDIASFPDGADGLPVKDLTVDIEPVQDLHGYANPWPGGGGKNLLDSDTVFADLTISVQYKVLTLKPNTSYTCSTNLPLQDGNVANVFFMRPEDTAGTNINGVSLYVSRTVISNSNGEVKVGYRLPSDGTTTEQYLSYHYQIEEGSTATSYTPYSNICPISGWTGCNVARTGKNLANIPDITATGGDYILDKAPIALLRGTYTLSWETSIQSGETLLVARTTNNVELARETVQTHTGELTFTIDYACATISIYTNSTGDLKDFQIELGSRATEFVPFVANDIYPITFSSSAGTVYGGTLDVTSGVLTVTDANIASYNGETLLGEWISDRDVYAAGTTPTTGAQVVYKLATPQTYQLTPTEVTTLLGQNNIWADCGPSTVEYPADTKLYIQKINTPTDDDMIADANIASGKYFINNNNLYLSTTAILAGDPIKPGTNCTLTNLAAALNAINS